MRKDRNINHYASAKRRFLTEALSSFFSRELVRTGPELSRMLAERVCTLLEEIWPHAERVKPGQIVWMAVDKHTRPGAANERLRRVLLTVSDPGDVEAFKAGEGVRAVRRRAIARMLNEAFEQGAVLSTRDLSMILHQADVGVSRDRMAFEEMTGQPLPHNGTVHDIGTTISHKTLIIRKVVCEHKDPAQVARETRHSQRSVDNYLKAFNRVRTLHSFNKDPQLICLVTGMGKRLVNEYITIILDMENE